jgi:predicted acylesterase/phospholipase RssA
MFGAYQAGVWQELAQYFRPDIVVGASVGSLNGWMIASGCSGAALVDRWLQLEQLARLRWRRPKGPGEGLIECQALEQWTRETCAACQPETEYGVVTTDLFTMQPQLHTWPDLTWQHLAASCAVPVFLPLQRIGGRLCADGGLVDPLPLWASVRMGARRIVSVNLLNVRPLAVRAAVRAACWYGRYAPERQFPGVRIVEINPARPLGRVKDSLYWSAYNCRRWIEQGRFDASSLKHLVVECLEPHGCVSHISDERGSPSAIPLGASHDRCYGSEAKGL